MREHRYKAKRLYNNEWIEGYLWRDTRGSYYIRKEIGLVYATMVDFEVDPDTICEFTELYDKNKNMIYEHDIIQNCYSNKKEVKYGIWNCGCCYDVYGWDIFNNEDESLEVIGNIFDNPELLEVK